MAKPYLAVILIFADLVGMVIRPINELPEQLPEALQVSQGGHLQVGAGATPYI